MLSAFCPKRCRQVVPCQLSERHRLLASAVSAPYKKTYFRFKKCSDFSSGESSLSQDAHSKSILLLFALSSRGALNREFGEYPRGSELV